MTRILTNASRAADTLTTFDTAAASTSTSAARYAVRQVLDQEYQQYIIRQRAEARQARFSAGGLQDAVLLPKTANDTEQRQDLQSKVDVPAKVKRDFFGRIISNTGGIESVGANRGVRATPGSTDAKKGRIWVSYNEGYSNAVKKKITLAELMRGM